MTIQASIKGDRVYVTSDLPFRDNPRIQELPGSSHNGKTQQWDLPLTWSSLKALAHDFKGEFYPDEEVLQWIWTHHREVVEPASRLRLTLDAPGNPNLYPHQRSGVQYMKLVQKGLICDDPGAGKSPLTVDFTRAVWEEDQINPFPMLLVAPSNMLLKWEREISTWYPGLKVSIIRGSAAKRRKLLAEPAHVYIINFETMRFHSRLAPYGKVSLKRCVECDKGLRELVAIETREHEERIQPYLEQGLTKITEIAAAWEADNAGDGSAPPPEFPKPKLAARHSNSKCHFCERELNKIKWTSVVVDEVHRIADPTSQQTRAVWSCAHQPNVRFRWGLTGTPVTDTPDTVWSLLHFFDPIEFPGKTKFFDRFFEVRYTMWGGVEEIVLKESMKEEFFAIIDHRFRRVTKDVVLPFLPPIVREVREIELTSAQQRMYEQMRKGMMAEADSGVISKVDNLSKAMRLHQLASGTLDVTVTEDPDDPAKMIEDVWMKMPSNKVDALLEILQELHGESVAVFALSRQLIGLCETELGKAGIPFSLLVGGQSVDEAQRHIDEFQAGKTKVILITIQAGGTGVTLTAASTAVFLQRPWSNVQNVQAEGRVHRPGSEVHEKIRIIDLVSAGTIDYGVREAVERKNVDLQVIVRDDEVFRKLIWGEDPLA